MHRRLACYACIQELSTTSIDDDYVTDDELDGYSCNEFVDFLHGHNVCSSTNCNDPHLFWTLIDACNEDDDGDDDDFIDESCSATECVVTHEEYLGDGWCDYDTGGCYNSEVRGTCSPVRPQTICHSHRHRRHHAPTAAATAVFHTLTTAAAVLLALTATAAAAYSKACGYDHGDCCPSTCVSTPSISCGDHGYECIDPTEQTSCDEDTTYAMHMVDAYVDGKCACGRDPPRAWLTSRGYLTAPSACRERARVERRRLHDRGDPVTCSAGHRDTYDGRGGN